MAAPETWRAPPVVVRSQIIENCSFFSPPGAQLSAILTREPLGTYKAIILRTEFGGQREVVLSSESADTVNRAFELLLVKSADAVQNYITTNGFEFAPSSKKVQDVVHDDEEDDDDDDDGVSSVSSSEVIDDDSPKNLVDSTMSLSEAESAYESVSEDGIDVRYPRARATHTSRNTTTTAHAYPMRVRRSRSPRRPDDPEFPREGRQQQRASSYYSPHHNFPIHRRRPSSPMRGPPPNSHPDAAGVDGPMGRHIPPPPPPLVGGAPPAPPLRPIHPGGGGGGGGGGGAWRHVPGGPALPPVLHANAINIRAELAGPPRPHPSQYFTLHPPLPPPPPPPPEMRLGPIQPPPAGAMQQQQQQYPQGKPPVGINRDADGRSPTMQAAAAVPQPPPSSSSFSSSSPSLLSSTSSTPTLTASPNNNNNNNNNKSPPAAPAPAAIDYRLCIRSRGPGAPAPQGGGGGAQAQAGPQQQQQWHEKRIVLRTPPTRTHVRAAALRFIEQHPGEFRHLGDLGGGGGYLLPYKLLDGGGGDGRQQQQQHLRAALARAVFGDGESYDLSTYAGDDLSLLCASMCAAGQAGMPLFEVTVSNVGPAASYPYIFMT